MKDLHRLAEDPRDADFRQRALEEIRELARRYCNIVPVGVPYGRSLARVAEYSAWG